MNIHEKVEIPKFVADYITEARQEGYHGVDIFDYVYVKPRVADWVDKGGNFTKLAQAIEFGYVVEKVPAVIQFAEELKDLMIKHGVARITNIEGKNMSLIVEDDDLKAINTNFHSNTNTNELRRYLRNNGADFTNYDE